MLKNFKLAEKLDWKHVRFKDPRVLMRALIGVLLAANLAMAVVAFKPFGGSADDLRREQQTLSAQLRTLQLKLEASKSLVAKVEIARTEGDEFLSRYVIPARSMAETTLSEMYKAATEAGIRALPSVTSNDPIEGSDTLEMVTITQGFEGTYAALTKLVNLLEKSPRFLILDSMQLNATQAQQNAVQAGPQVINVTLKVLTFARDESGAGL
jgi:type IV pilus assembly protein PilO